MLEIIIQKIIIRSQLRDWGQRENAATCYRTKKKPFHSNSAITIGPYAPLTVRDPLDKSLTQSWVTSGCSSFTETLSYPYACKTTPPLLRARARNCHRFSSTTLGWGLTFSFVHFSMYWESWEVRRDARRVILCKPWFHTHFLEVLRRDFQQSQLFYALIPTDLYWSSTILVSQV